MAEPLAVELIVADLSHVTGVTTTVHFSVLCADCGCRVTSVLLLALST